MASRDPWRTYRRKAAARKLVPWVIYPAALIGMLNACSSACTPAQQETNSPQSLAAQQCGRNVVTAFLRSSSDDTSPAASYFDVSQIEFPKKASTIIAASPAPAGDQGDGAWLTTTAVTTAVDTQNWLQFVQLAKDANDKYQCSTIGTPAPFPGNSYGSPIAVEAQQDIPEDNDTAKTAIGFLRAWLSGDGDPQRFAKPDAFEPWLTAPYTSIKVNSITTNGSVPAKPTGKLTVTVSVSAQARYPQQLSYTLSLTADNGQWLVDSLKLMPPHKTDN
ncbi:MULTISPECIES: conjugal transfer protein [Mycolicibacterium]|nr:MULTISPECIES: conjugal transfer protein [Mycolicibacterium]MCV7002195.1 conjugal transfer protein [Mycolicibacterium alvei]